MWTNGAALDCWPRNSVLLAVLLAAGCATVPSGPTVMALPGTGKTFDQFRLDDADCRQFAYAQIGGVNAGDRAADLGVRDAAVGAAIGALAGAAIGGRDSAGVGAGTGLLFGSMGGAGASQAASRGSQRQYDHAYIQCMYAKGQRVPVSGSLTQRSPVGAPGSESFVPPAPPVPLPPPPGASR